jgi:phosphatidate cytidylyltransferase
VLAGATVLVRFIAPDPRSELRQRMQSWWVMIGIFAVVMVIDRVAATIFLGFIAFLALKEYLSLIPTRRIDRFVLLWAYLAIPVQFYLAHIGWYGMFIVFIPVWMFLWLPLRLVLARETRGFVAAMSQIQWGLMAFVFGLSHLAWMATWEPAESNGVDGRALVLFLVFTVEMSDVLQFCFGKAFGRRKILPEVSPNKTWEGFVLGVLAASGLSLALGYLTPFGTVATFGFALAACVSGFAGGAVMSAVKRDFGAKDFGTLLPGHGGMIDRVDSLCYAAPVFVHLVRWLYL